MTIREYTHPTEPFRAVQFDGLNLDEVIELVGEGNVLRILNGEPVIDLGGSQQDTVRVGWWVSRRDGHLYVSSGSVGSRWAVVS